MLDKAKDFAVEIINMCKNIKETKRESVLTNQLIDLYIEARQCAV